MATDLERWSVDAGPHSVARLDIPPHAQREREFEIFVGFTVVNRGGHEDASHGLRVLVNGALEWSRKVPTHRDGTDTLDLRLRRTVPVGEPLRLTATGETVHARRVSLVITAEEG